MPGTDAYFKIDIFRGSVRVYNRGRTRSRHRCAHPPQRARQFPAAVKVYYIPRCFSPQIHKPSQSFFFDVHGKMQMSPAGLSDVKIDANVGRC